MTSSYRACVCANLIAVGGNDRHRSRRLSRFLFDLGRPVNLMDLHFHQLLQWDFGQVTIRNAYVHDNDCRGLWADINAHDALIENNLIEHNLTEGIFYEISQGAVIRDNQLAFPS